ncbi:MAG: hypothetical protein F4W98_06165 [Acidimicrobiales bacterium]|nr:hypothetical protein [Acidimicrobiales bacterium]
MLRRWILAGCKNPGTHHDRLVPTIISFDGEICSGELRYKIVLSKAGLCENASHGLAQAFECRRASTAILGDDRHKKADGLATLLDNKRLPGRDQLGRAITEFPYSY